MLTRRAATELLQFFYLIAKALHTFQADDAAIETVAQVWPKLCDDIKSKNIFIQGMHNQFRPVTRGGSGSDGGMSPQAKQILCFAYFPVKLGLCTYKAKRQ